MGQRTYFGRLSRNLFAWIVGVTLSSISTLLMAENCMIYARDMERLHCFEENRHSTRGDSSVDVKAAPSKPQSAKEISRKPATVNTQVKAGPKEQSEDVNSALNALASDHLRRDQTMEYLRQERAYVARESAWQSSRLINSCATEYCKTYLAPYQEKVDEFRGQGNSAAKQAAERELHWQLIRNANPP